MTDAHAPTLPLLAWTSSGFPVGGFTYSHGLETAVDAELVTGIASLSAWLADLLTLGSGRTDAILAAVAWRAVRDDDPAGLAEANDLAVALAPSRERQLETTGQGNAFASTIRAGWPVAPIAWPEGDVAYPVAFGAVCAAAGMPLRPAIEAFALGFVQNLVSAAIRLGAVGQTDGQRAIAAAVPIIIRLAAEAETSTLDDLGGCAQRSDVMAMRHETLYSRLFRS